jgi:hypothetical protein
MALFHSIVRVFRVFIQPHGKVKALSAVGVRFAHSSSGEKIGNCAQRAAYQGFSRGGAAIINSANCSERQYLYL